MRIAQAQKQTTLETFPFQRIYTVAQQQKVHVNNAGL